jgi:CheY-like chemotaxis protein
MDCEGLPSGPELTVCQAARAAADAASAARQLAEGDSWSEIVVAILGAIGALALPVLAVVVLILVWPIMRSVFETRKFTLKIGGFELSAQEATDQIRKQIEELQAQLAELREGGRPLSPPLPPAPFDDVMPPPAPRPSTVVPPPQKVGKKPVETVPPPFDIAPAAPVSVPPVGAAQLLPGAILWVDDKPSNNAFLIADFQDQKIAVDQALSTNEAMQKLAARSADYRVIISDLGRTENNRYVPDAGGQLAREMRAMGLSIPLLIFSSAQAAQDRDRLLASGANEVTNSSTRVRSWVMRHFKGRAG